MPRKKLVTAGICRALTDFMGQFSEAQNHTYQGSYYYPAIELGRSNRSLYANTDLRQYLCKILICIWLAWKQFLKYVVANRVGS